MYYNTVGENRQALIHYAESNQKQDKLVYYVCNILVKFSASQIFKDFPRSETPITSIRRSLNTLKKKGLIEETGNKVKGLYGRNESEYKLV